MTESAPVHCECGDAGGDTPCTWTGPVSETVTVEWMPEWLRDSHDAAGNPGCYPYNGSIRLRVERFCADRLIEDDGEWTSIVG